jgi:hypothetical protein
MARIVLRRLLSEFKAIQGVGEKGQELNPLYLQFNYESRVTFLWEP